MQIRLACACIWLSRLAAAWRSGAVDTSRWEFYARQPVLRGARLGVGACRAAAAEWRARRLARRAKGDAAARVRRRAARRVADLLVELGPTYVKLGQIASCRRELVDTEWAPPLQRLQDQVPAFPGGEAELRRRLGRRFEERFEAVDGAPVAAASLGQVHLATLRDGRRVAVKVQRPNLKAIYDKDVALLRTIFKALDRFKVSVGVDQAWGAIFDDAADLLYREIDYRCEAAHAREFAENFRDAPWVTTPEIFDDLSTEHVLTMAYVPGVSLKDVAAIEADPSLDAKSLARNLARCYLLQFCRHGFFNTDPHAGNLAADAAIPKGRLIVYDFGQAARLDENERAGALMLLEALLDEDAELCVDAFSTMGVLKEGYDREAILATVADNFRAGRVATGKGAARRGATAAAGPPPAADAAAADFRLPATLAFVSRALSQMQGVGEALDPAFEFVGAVAPYVPEAKGGAKYAEDRLRRAFGLAAR